MTELSPGEISRREAAANVRKFGLTQVLLFNGLILAILLCTAIPSQVRVVVDNLAQCLGPFALFLWTLHSMWTAAREQRARGVSGRALLHWPPLFLSLGVLGYAVGQGIWTYYEQVLHRETPFPSWADAGYLSAYPFLFLGMLTLPMRLVPITARLRVLFDSLMVMGALVTFSWYFVLGPTLMQSGESLLAKALGTAYPLSDVMLLLCVLLLFLRSGSTTLRPMIALLSSGLCAIIAIDTVFDYQTLHHTYETGHPVDLGWTAGYMLVGVAARAVCFLGADGADAGVPAPAPRGVFVYLADFFKRLRVVWPTLLPYVVMPAMAGLVWHTTHTQGDDHLKPGVYVGATLLIVLLVIRQLFIVLENHHLTSQLRAFNVNLEQVVVQRTQELAHRGEELRARTEQLAALQQLTAAVNETLDVGQVLSAAIQHTREALHADGVALWLTAHEELAPGLPLRHLDGLQNSPEVVAYLDTLPILEQATVSALPTFPAGAYLQAALRWQGQWLGRIGVLCWEGGFEPADGELLQSIGLQVAAALGNAHQYHAVREAADHDSVTGLLNHRAIHDYLDKALCRAGECGQPLAVIMTDMNNFKMFNDTYGHPVGDQVLQKMARLLSETCGALGEVGRYGGDEFLIVLPGLDVAQVLAVAQRLRDRVAQEAWQPEDDGHPIPLGLSFGVAVSPHDGENRHDLLRIADMNLYAAKNSDERIVGMTEMQRANRELRAHNSYRVLDSMVTAVDNKDRYTRRHSEDVAAYALWIAEELNLPESLERTLRIGALLHDVGKIGVPDQILRKPRPLTEDEYDILKQHAALGAMIVTGVPGMEEIVDLVRYHHERWDGGGYPEGLSGETIPVTARILAVADAVSAMTSDRPYRPAKPWEEALEEVRLHSGTQFDPLMAQAFLRAAERYRETQVSVTPPFLETASQAA